MRSPPEVHLYSSHSPASARPNNSPQPSVNQSIEKPPRQPDWVLIMVGLLMLLTLLIAWLVDIP